MPRAARAQLWSVCARADGSVLDLPDCEACADGGSVGSADPQDFIAMPPGTLLLSLPGRAVVGLDRGGAQKVVRRIGEEQVTAVGAALPLGYTRLLLPAYVEREHAPRLPLYGYAAVAWAQEGFVVAAARTDRLESWAAASHGEDAIREGIAVRSLEFGGNALIAQLARCATEYGCFTAQNIFLRQGEGALPVSPACNAACLGCISEQDQGAQVRSAQERLRVHPSVEDISVVAAAHLAKVPGGLVSFGQGCEGEPLLFAPLIEQAIRRIRQATAAGIIHCNTNASRPQALERLIDCGLQSIRVSLNSVRPATYAAYYRPRGYSFEDVRASIALAARRGIKISLNLLTHPGVTDDPAEMKAFAQLLRELPIGMVQTRTLNVDPALYFAATGRPVQRPFGMRAWLRWMNDEFPAVRLGNFTRGFG